MVEIDCKELYGNLALKLKELGCDVWDYDYHGFAGYIGKNIKAFVYINPRLKYRDRLFVLAHEAGHLFTLEKNQRFRWSKKARSEKQANWFAIQLIKQYSIRVQEYHEFYDKMQKRNKKKRKNWESF